MHPGQVHPKKNMKKASLFGTYDLIMNINTPNQSEDFSKTNFKEKEVLSDQCLLTMIQIYNHIIEQDK